MPTANRPFRRLLVAGLMLVGLVLLGTVGYRAIAELSWLDALYQTMITLSSVGYQDLAPEARVFTVIMVGFGTVSLAILISLITAALVEVRLHQFIGRRKVEGSIRKLKNHFVVCGGGRFGRTISEELARKGAPFVIIERDADRAEALRERDCLVVTADATEEEVLEQAGVARAEGLLAALGSDADNVYAIITAKQLAPSVKIVSIARDEHAGRKLKAAGADEVVAPYLLGGNWMAQIVTSPTVADFMKMTTGTHAVDFFMDEQKIGEHSVLSGKELRETPIRSDFGVIVVAVRQSEGELITNPPGHLKLGPNDVLVSLGKHEKLAALRDLAAGS